MDENVIAVTGATGQQGGATARKLLAGGWKVRALTRDANKPAAQQLAAMGAEIVPGDMDNPRELEAAFAGASRIFSVQNYWLPDVGYEGEIRQGKNVADAAKAAKVEHLVYSSVGAANRGAGQKHFDSKWIIEQYIHALGVPYTILRPAAFMENFNWARAQILNGVYVGRGLRPEKSVQTIAVEDIAGFAALAFENPKQYIGKTIELAGDDETEAETAAAFAKVIGRPVALEKPTPGAGRGARSGDEMKAMFTFFNGEGYDADIPALRKLHPGLMTLEQWLRKNGWENAQAVPMQEQNGRG